MGQTVAVVGAGVSGLTCAVVLAERGYRAAIFAEHIGPGTTSGAAAAIWFPYDAGPSGQAIFWALETYRTLVDLTRDPRSGVSMLELRQFSRTREIEIPEWALPLGARRLRSEIPPAFVSGFAIDAPLMDTTIYLDYLAQRFLEAGGEIQQGRRLAGLEEIDRSFDLIVNCTGIGARTLVGDFDLEPHRGQVAIVPKIDLPYAFACDDPPLTYAIPRANDCVLGGTNDLSESSAIDPSATARIVAECGRVLDLDKWTCSANASGSVRFVVQASASSARNCAMAARSFTTMVMAAPVLRSRGDAPRRWPHSPRARCDRSDLFCQVSSIAWKELITSSGPLSLKKHS